MEHVATSSRRGILAIAALFALFLFGFFYVMALGGGWRVFIYVNGGILFLAALGFFMKDAKSFLLFMVVFGITFGLGRHVVYERMPFESVLFSSGIRIDSVDVVLVVLMGYWGQSVARRQFRGKAFTLGNPIGSLFLIWIVVSVFLSLMVAKEPRFSMFEAFVMVKGFLLFLTLVNTIKEERDLRIVVLALMAMGAVQALYLVFQYITRTTYTIYGGLVTAPGGEAGFRSPGFYGGPDTHAVFLVTIFPIFLAGYLVYTEPAKRFAALMAMLLIVLGLMTTKVRIAGASLLLGSIVVVVVSQRRGWITFKKASYLFIVGTFLLILMVPLVYQQFTTRLYGQDRIPLMLTALNIIKSHLITGVGMGNYNFDVEQYVPVQERGKWLYTVHNQYLLILAEQGIVAAMIYYSMLLAAMRRYWIAAKSNNHLIFMISAAFFGVLIGSLPHRIVSMYHYQQYFYLYCVMLALAYVLPLMSRQASQFSSQNNGGPLKRFRETGGQAPPPPPSFRG
jgi:O-antigen ligase